MACFEYKRVGFVSDNELWSRSESWAILGKTPKSQHKTRQSKVDACQFTEINPHQCISYDSNI